VQIHYAWRMNIVFDFGNVLFTWDPVALVNDHFPAAERAAWDVSELANALIYHDDWQAFDAGLLDADELAQRCAVRLNLRPQTVADFIVHVPNVLPTIDVAVDCAKALIAGELGAHRAYYLSNMPAPWADVIEARCPWVAQFHGGLFSARVKLAKPDAAIYEAAESALSLVPAETLFLDDSPRNVAAARVRGWRAEIITSPQDVFVALRAHGVM
jgi:putative hydrolase of the HAD superfamily